MNLLNETFSAATGQKFHLIPTVLAVPFRVCLRNDGSDLFLLEINWVAHP